MIGGIGRARVALGSGLALAALALAGSAPARAETPAADTGLAALQAKLPGKLINDPRALVSLWDSESRASQKPVQDKRIPGGGAALQVTIAKPTSDVWKVTASQPLTQTVAMGDPVTIGFFARALPHAEGKAEGRVSVRVQQSVEPWAGFLGDAVTLGPDWQWYEVHGTATTSILAGQGAINLQLADRAQTVQIGQVMAVSGASSIAHPEGKAGSSMPLPQAMASLNGAVVSNPQGGPWNFYAAKDGSQAQIADKSAYGGKATRVTVPAAHAQAYEVSIGVPIEGALAEGEQLAIGFLVRTQSAETADGLGVVGFRVQSNQAPYDGFGDHRITVGPNWKLIQLRTTVTKAIPAGNAMFSLFLGEAKQTLDIGPVFVVKLAQ